MRSVFSKTFLSVLFLSLLPFMTGAGETLTVEPSAKLLPDRIGTFKATSRVRPVEDYEGNFNDVSAGERDYQSTNGERLTLTLFKSTSDSGAYARFNQGISSPSSTEKKIVSVGTLGYAAPKAVLFFKGPVSVAVNARELPDYSETLVGFARQFAETLDKGEGDVPALVKHLPDWQSGNLRSLYSVNLAGLKLNVPNQPVVDVINFDGGVEAVSANYGPSQLVIVEFNTPQLATDNTGRILAKIEELRNQGQPVPSAYRRVGNYEVFVFDAPSALAANQLIDQVKYQQVVQWLGKNPYSYREAVSEFTQTTLGVLVSVVKASGLVFLGSLAVGGFLGAVLFTRRRAQQQVRDAYSDAGGMLRLNLDEVNPKTDAARLLGPGN